MNYTYDRIAWLADMAGRDGTLDVTIADMVGHTVSSVHQLRGRHGEDALMFVDDSGAFVFYHYQDCCESIVIENIIGDLDHLIGSPLLEAEEIPPYDPYYPYTTHRFSTVEGVVTVRWHSSHGLCDNVNEYPDLVFIPPNLLALLPDHEGSP